MKTSGIVDLSVLIRQRFKCQQRKPMQICKILIIYMLLFSVTAHAQVAEPLEELLKFLPDRSYEKIRMVDAVRLGRIDYANVVQQLILPRLRYTSALEALDYLPPGLKDDIDSVVQAIYVSDVKLFKRAEQYTRMQDEQLENYRGRRFFSRPAFAWIGEQQVLFQIEKKEVLILRSVSALQVLEELTVRGNLATSGRTAGKQEIHLLKHTIDGDRREVGFCYIPPDIILVADEVDMLQQMVDAGMGKSIGFSGSDQFFEMQAVEREMGPLWNCTFYNSYRPLLHRRLEQAGFSYSELQEAQQAGAEVGPIIILTTISLDDVVSNIELELYHSHEQALERKKRMNQPSRYMPGATPNPQYVQFVHALRSAARITVDGSRVTRKTEYTPELVEELKQVLATGKEDK